jgi:hypothetical protein
MEFFNAVRKHLTVLLTSTTIVGALFIWQGTGHNVKTWLYWVVLVGGFGVACFQTLEDEKGRTEEQKHRADAIELKLNGLIEEQRTRAESIQLELNELKVKLNEPRIGTEFWLEERKPASHVMRYYVLGKIYNEGETVSDIYGEMSFQPETFNEQYFTRIQRQYLSKSAPIELEPRELPGQAITDRVKMRGALKIPVRVRFSYASQTGEQHIYEARYEYDALSRQFVLQEPASSE